MSREPFGIETTSLNWQKKEPWQKRGHGRKENIEAREEGKEGKEGEEGEEGVGMSTPVSKQTRIDSISYQPNKQFC